MKCWMNSYLDFYSKLFWEVEFVVELLAVTKKASKKLLQGSLVMTSDQFIYLYFLSRLSWDFQHWWKCQYSLLKSYSLLGPCRVQRACVLFKFAVSYDVHVSALRKGRKWNYRLFKSVGVAKTKPRIIILTSVYYCSSNTNDFAKLFQLFIAVRPARKFLLPSLPTVVSPSVSKRYILMWKWFAFLN